LLNAVKLLPYPLEGGSGALVAPEKSDYQPDNEYTDTGTCQQSAAVFVAKPVELFTFPPMLFD